MQAARTLSVSLATAAVALVGCGGSSEPPPEPPPSPAEVSPAPGTPPAKTVSVKMKEIQYLPKEVRVAAGGTVTWDNTDEPPHTVTKEAGPGDEFDSGTLQPGQKYEHSFKEPGRVEYICDIHPGQRGTVVVE